MRYRSDRCSGGFTLLELIIVMFIAGIGLGIAGLAVARSYEKEMLRQDAARLQNMMRYARELSLMQREPVGFTFDEEGLYWLEKNGAPLGKKRAVRKGYILKGEPTIFLPKGNNTGGYVTITDSRERGFAIEVDPVTGRTTVRRL